MATPHNLGPRVAVKTPDGDILGHLVETWNGEYLFKTARRGEKTVQWYWYRVALDNGDVVDVDPGKVRTVQEATDDMICGVICNAGPNGEPLACGYPSGHDGVHSWSTLPTFDKDAPELVAIGRVAIRLYQCQCEFEDQPGCCSEWQETLDSMIDAYLIARMSREELKSRLMARGYDGEALETFAALLRQAEQAG